MPSAKERQSEFAYELGLLLRPIVDIIDRPQDFDLATRKRRRAQFQSEASELQNRLDSFCTEVMGVPASEEIRHIVTPLGRIMTVLRQSLERISEDGIKQQIDNLRREVLTALFALPTHESTMTFGANTPYSTYLRLKALFDAATREVIYGDRYVDASLFYRYLSRLQPGVKVIVVARKDEINAPDFLDASRLYAQERGPHLYRLLEEPDFHARLLQIDDQFMLLDGSIKHAGHKSPGTLSTLPAQDGTRQIQDLLGKAKELFGPSQSNHP